MRNIMTATAALTAMLLSPPATAAWEPAKPVEIVVAAGAENSYFGHDEWRTLAPGLKTVEDALAIRSRILGAFEAAELELDPDLRRSWLTFVVVGGGPTGVELAGQIAEIARDTLRRDFRNIDPRAARIVLIESAPRVLSHFPERLSARAASALERLGVTPALNRIVVDVDPEAVTVEAPGGERERIVTRTAVWAAGVRAAGLAGQLAEASRATVDRAGRVAVRPDLTVPGYPEAASIAPFTTSTRATSPRSAGLGLCST